MSQRENNPNIRKYSTCQGNRTTNTTSIHRATDILFCLSNDINTVTDIASYHNYSPSTVHRLLQTLKELDWVIQDNSTHKYFLGSLFTQLSSNQAENHKYLVLHALRDMVHLSNMTEETVNLGILTQLHYVLLHDIPSQHNLRISEESTKLAGLYTGATAKVLLSQLDDKDLKEALQHIKFERVTKKTVTDKQVLMKQIKEIRHVGYSVSYGERIHGAVCISAPLDNYLCPATLSIVGPTRRLKPRVDQVIGELKASAERINSDIIGAFQKQGGEA